MLWFAMTSMGGPTVSAGPGGSINDFQISPTDSTAELRFYADGTVRENTADSGLVTLGRWDNNITRAGADWEIGYTGTPTTAFDTEAAASDAWVDISTTRTWGYTETGIGTKNSGNLTFRIRRAGSGSILDTAVYSITASVDA